MVTPRKLSSASSLAAAKERLRFSLGPGDGGALPWDIIGEKVGELLRFLTSAAQALAVQLQEHTASLFAALAAMARAALAVAVPAAAVVVVLLVLCRCCVAAGQRRRRRGPDGEEVDGLGCRDGPVVSYCGGYKYNREIFSMHPNKPIVC
ncbi:unnamed protein product [Urochloa humidicola]